MNRLPFSTKTLLVVVCLNAIANSLSSIFVNVYILKLTQDFYQVTLFNFITYLFWLPAFVLAGYLSKKTDRKKGLLVGSGFQLLFYLAVLLLGNHTTQWLWIVGSLNGIGSGFYWLSVNVLSVDLTDEGNRVWFNGINGVFGSFAQMIGPFIAGWMVELVPGGNGYKLLFLASFCLFLFSMYYIVRLPSIVEKASFDWPKLWKIHRNPNWMRLSFGFVGLSFRDGVLGFVIWLWIYMAAHNEGIVGNYAFITTACSMLTYYLAGKYGDIGFQWRQMSGGTLGLCICLFSLWIHVDGVTLLFYTFVSAVCNPLIQMPFGTLTLNSISQQDEQGKKRIELVVAREIALSVGRITSVGLLVVLYTQAHSPMLLRWYLLLILIIGAAPVYLLKPKANKIPSNPSFVRSN